MEKKQKYKTQYKFIQAIFWNAFVRFSHYHSNEMLFSQSAIYWPRENERRTFARARHACQGNVGTKQTIVFQAEVIPVTMMLVRYYCHRATTTPCTGTVATWLVSSSDVA